MQPLVHLSMVKSGSHPGQRFPQAVGWHKWNTQVPIVFSWSWTKDTPDGAQLHPDSPETQVTVEFFARGSSTEVVLTHAVFGSAKDRDEHNQGWNGCLDALARVLQTTSTPS
jgi:uncharacterized protein YndB with AHSA1/START domain